MAVDTEHPEYAAKKSQWQKIRDCKAGQEAIHMAGQRYLPRLSGQTDADYKAYVSRAPFYGATGRTIDGLTGMIFRKPLSVKVPAGLQPVIEDVTLSGLGIQEFSEQLVDEIITVGRAGILVDHPQVMAETTLAQAEAMNIRPFLKTYTAENILNWKTSPRNNVQVLTQVRLLEVVEVQKDEFDVSQVVQIRVLDLNEADQYRQRIFWKNDKGEWVQVSPDIIPLKNGAPMDFIPFEFVGVSHSSIFPEKPPLIDLVNINISHYVSTADLEHGAHFTGLPTAVITGHVDDMSTGEGGAEYRIGSATAWVFPSDKAKAYYLEFQGQGLEALERRLAKKEEYMAFLGARMLAPDKKAAETAETAQIHRLGENSILSSIAQSVSEAIEKSLRIMADWYGFAGEIEFKLNKDFLAAEMSPQQLMALLATWQAGGIAFEDFLDNLKRGEIVRQERMSDDIRSEVEGENPFLNEQIA